MTVTSDASGKASTLDYTNPAGVTDTYTDSSGAAKKTMTLVDFDGRQVSYTDELNNASTRAYDQASRVTGTARAGSPLSVVGYDPANRVTAVTDTLAGGVFQFGYDPAGRLLTTARPNGVTTTQVYAPTRGWLTGITNTATGGPLPANANSAYTPSPANRITTQTTEGLTSTFGYDGAGRLTTTVVGGITTTYAYDLNSNRCALNASTCAAPTYFYNAADRITASPGRSSYSYNAHGDVTATAGATFAYDANDHATSIFDGTTTVSSEVAPSGRVLQRSSNGTAPEDTLFGFDSSSDSPSYSEAALLGIPTGPVVSYLNGPGGLLAIDTGTSPVYPLANGHGDLVGTTGVTATFTANPATDAFGVGAQPANHLGYLGNDERFATGAALSLIQMGVRLYDPSLGRFLQPDPVAGGSANAYDYCYQDPVNCFDLDGKFGFKGFFKSFHRILSPIAASFQAAALAGSFLEVVPVLGEAVAAVQAASAGLNALDAASECISGEVGKGGCAVLIAGAILSGALPGLGHALAETVEDSKNLEVAVHFATGLTGATIDRSFAKLAHTGR